MRNATILVVNLRGVATETIKNIVLAGIGKLIIWDREDVAAEDLGAGFFFRDGDIGKKVHFFLPLCPPSISITSLVASGIDAVIRPLPVLPFVPCPRQPATRRAYSSFYLFIYFSRVARGCREGSHRESQSASGARDYHISIGTRARRIRRAGATGGPGVHNRLGAGLPRE
jgi:hypothetical protein